MLASHLSDLRLGCELPWSSPWLRVSPAGWLSYCNCARLCAYSGGLKLVWSDLLAEWSHFLFVYQRPSMEGHRHARLCCSVQGMLGQAGARGFVLVGSAVATFDKLTVLIAGVLPLLCTGWDSCRTQPSHRQSCRCACFRRARCGPVLACLDHRLSGASLGQPTWVQTGQPGCQQNTTPEQQAKNRHNHGNKTFCMLARYQECLNAKSPPTAAGGTTKCSAISEPANNFTPSDVC